MLKYHIQTIEVNNTLTNLITNPSFETNTTGWTRSGGTSFNRITTDSVFGSACGQFIATGAGNLMYTDISVTTAQTYVFSAYVKGEAGKTVSVDLEEVGVGTTVGTSITMNGTWQRMSVTRTFTTGTTARCRVQNRGAVSNTILIDGVMLTAGASTHTYFDGNTTGVNDTSFAWTGTANNSSSTRTSASLTTVRRNIALNPNIELGTQTLGAQRLTFALETTTKYFGNQSLRATVTSTAGIQYIDAQLYPVTAGLPYTASVYLFMPLTNSSDRTVRIELHPHTGTGYLGRMDGNLNISVPRGQWVRITASGTAPATAVSVLIRVVPTTTLALDDVMIVDGYLLEQSSTVGEYFDGNTPSSGSIVYSWEGAVGSSASLQQVVETTGSSNTSDITFNNIPQIYDDLLIVTSARGSDGTGYGKIVFNSGVESTKRRLYGSGSSVASDTNAAVDYRVNGSDQTASTFSNSSIYIANYSSSTSNKSYSIDTVNENNDTYAVQQLVAGLVSTTTPLSRVSLVIGGGTFSQYSSASLYGIKRGSSGQVEVASGGTISTSGGYTYHTFTSSGTFVANRYVDAQVLVVAGGGSGGYDRGSGGGAGGYLASSVSLPTGSYAVTVGAGGSSQTGYTQNNPGTNSSFFNLLAIGGGSGRDGSAGAGRDGGSGSGGASGPFGAGGLGTVGQGNAGGSTGTSTGGSGGGGGAGTAGANGGAANGAGGAGGNGLQWLNGTTYAGGGGGGAAMDFASPRSGGTGGSGGGGAGGNTNGAAGAAGTANTGGGGGGGANIPQGNGGAGGSGVVIIRYLTPA